MFSSFFVSLSFPAEISALFDSGSSVIYVFQEPYPVTKNTSLSSSAIYADTALSKETITLSFVTAQAPSLLLFLNFSSHDFLALLLCKNGELVAGSHKTNLAGRYSSCSVVPRTV